MNFKQMMKGPLKIVVVRGAGDIATGVIVRLKRAHIPVIALECRVPTSIRRTVSLSEAVYDGEMQVEGIKALLVHSPSDAVSLSAIDGVVPILVDEKGEMIKKIKPVAVVDAILAKRNLGTRITDAPCVVALGPGFTAGVDCHAVIETQRGHYLGQVIKEGSAIPNTGIPGLINGVGEKRVVHSPAAGVFKVVKTIGDHVEEGEIIATVDNVNVVSKISGTLRGIIRNNIVVTEGLKVADVDPRDEGVYVNTISDKARAISGGVLEALLSLKCFDLEVNKLIDKIASV